MRLQAICVAISILLAGVVCTSAVSTAPPANFSIGGLFTVTSSGLPYDFYNPQPLNQYACFNTTSGCAASSLYGTFKFQMEHINNDPTILPRTKLILDPIDDQGTASNGFFYAEKLYNRGNKVVVGPSSSTPTTNAALVAKVFNSPLIGFSASSPVLANKVQYPNFWRLCQNDATQGALMAWFSKVQFGWNKVALLYTTDAYGQGGAAKFVDAAAALNMTIISEQSFALQSTPDEVENPLRRIQKTGARVIIYFGQSTEFKTVIDRGDSLGMFNNQTAWFVNDAIVQFTAATTPTDIDQRAKTQGLIALTPDNGAGSKEFNDFATSYINYQFPASPYPAAQVFENYKPKSAATISYYTAFTADVVNVIARALHNLLEVQNNYDFTQQQFMAELSKVDMPGVSGRLAFDSNQDRVGLRYTLQNLNNGMWRRVGIYAENSFISDNGTSVVWHDGTTNVPLDDALPTPPSPPPTSHLATSSLTGLVVVTAILMGLLVIVFLGLLSFRGTRIMHAASPTMLSIVLLGAGLILSSVIVDAMNQIRWRCTLGQWFFNIGFTMAVGSMLLKTFRVHKIFNSKTFKVVSLSDVKLLQIMSAMIIFDVIVLALRSGLAPYVINENDSCDFDDGTAHNAAKALTIILIVSKAMMIAAAAYLSYAVRNLPQLYNESAYLAMAIYNCGLIGAVWIAIRYAVDFSSHPEVITIIEAALMLAAVFIVVSLVFVPKFVDLYHSEKHRMYYAALRKRTKSRGGAKMRKGVMKSAGNDEANATRIDDEDEEDTGSSMDAPSSPGGSKKKKTGPQTSAEVLALLEQALKDQQCSLETAFKDMEMSTKRAEDKKTEMQSITDVIFQINCEIDYYREVGTGMKDAEVAALFRDRLKEFHLVPESNKSSGHRSSHLNNAYAAVKSSMDGVVTRPSHGLSSGMTSMTAGMSRPLPKTNIPAYMARYPSQDSKGLGQGVSPIPRTIKSLSAGVAAPTARASPEFMTRSNSSSMSTQDRPTVAPVSVSQAPASASVAAPSGVDANQVELALMSPLGSAPLSPTTTFSPRTGRRIRVHLGTPVPNAATYPSDNNDDASNIPPSEAASSMEDLGGSKSPQ